MRNYFCVDVGGTKTALAIFDEEGNERFFTQFPTRPDLGAESLVQRVFACVESHLEGVVGGTIACPGPLDVHTGRIVYVATMGWKDVPIVRLFEQKFHMPFSLLNDCDAGGLGVWQYGGFSHCKNLCYVSISTGIGGGAVVDGRLLIGNGNAANFGHIPVCGEGLPCACGNIDCLELYASGMGLERRYAKKTGKMLSCAEIAKSALTGDETAQALFEQASQKLVFALRAVIAVLDPEVVVFGGSVCKSKQLFMPSVIRALPNLKIAYAREDGKQVLYGALAFARQQEKVGNK